MKLDFTTSNLSKIKPKFRTSGNISQPRRKAGSPLKDIGVTSVEKLNISTKDDYLKRLYIAFETTTDQKLTEFVYTQIKTILIQRGLW